MKTYKSWQKKTAKTTAVVEIVRDSILSMLPNADIILYGSRARGEANQLSDWDFLVLLDTQTTRGLVRQIRDKLYDAELEMDSILSAIVRSKKEWESDDYSILPFKKEVERDGVLL